MSEKSQLVLMAEYNQLMNQRMVQVSANLSNDLLVADKGAFFKSILGTLNHIMIGDILWLKRFSLDSSIYPSLKAMDEIDIPEELGITLFDDLVVFGKERAKLDVVILEWCNELKDKDINAPLQYSNFKGEIHNKRLGDLILHLFLHQIHHRGQVTTLLSQENVNFGETDLPEIIPEVD